jgi:UPF0716 family protein affecting phage T7 exclusion
MSRMGVKRVSCGLLAVMVVAVGVVMIMIKVVMIVCVRVAMIVIVVTMIVGMSVAMVMGVAKRCEPDQVHNQPKDADNEQFVQAT